MRTHYLAAMLFAAVCLSSASAFALESVEPKIVVFDDSVPTVTRLAVAARHGQVRRSLPSVRGVCILIKDSEAHRLRAAPGVVLIEDDYLVTASTARSIVKETTPLGVAEIGADRVWRYSRGTGVTVAVLDSGVDLTHPDLVSNLLRGYNALAPRMSPQDDFGHGTHVCGTIAASMNGLGVVGAAPAVHLMPVKVLDSQGVGRVSDVIEGLAWAGRHGADIINLSLGTPSYSRALERAISEARANGIVIVASAGNRGLATESTVDYPARFDGVIAVGGLSADGRVAEWSSWGSEVDVCAPGEAILSTYLNGEYATLSGSSMSTPHVTGALALKMEQSPDLQPDALEALLKTTSAGLARSGVVSDVGIVDVPRLMRSDS